MSGHYNNTVCNGTLGHVGAATQCIIIYVYMQHVHRHIVKPYSVQGTANCIE